MLHERTTDARSEVPLFTARAAEVGVVAALALALLGCGKDAGGPVPSEPRAPSAAEAPSHASSLAVGQPAPTASAATPPSASAPGTPATPSVDLTAKGSSPAGVPAAAYASLFTASKRWAITGTVERTGPWDDGPGKTTRTAFKAACAVASVESFTWGQLAMVECEDLPEAGSVPLLAGAWIATSEGLFWLGERPASTAAELAPGALVLTPQPVAGAEEKKEADTGFFSRREVTRARGGWCFDAMDAAGDEGWHGVCLDAARGFASGSYGWAGGSSAEVTFDAKPQ